MYKDSELWAAIGDQAHQDETLDKSVSVEEIAQSWLDRDRLPVLSVTRNYEKDTVIVLQVTQIGTSSDDPVTRNLTCLPASPIGPIITIMTRHSSTDYPN